MSYKVKIVRNYAPIVLIIALICLIWRAARATQYFDFGYVLTAGEMWLNGLNPYGHQYADYVSKNVSYIVDGGSIWVYPPQWFSISTSLAILGGPTAFFIWKMLTIAMIMSGTILIWRTSLNVGNDAKRWQYIAFLAATTVGDAAKVTQGIAQTSAILLFGIGLIVHGIQKERLWESSLGFALLLLKPQIGLLFLIFGLLSRASRPSAVAGGAISALMVLPLLISVGSTELIVSIHSLLENISRYSDLKWNGPLETTGFPFLIALAGMSIPKIAAFIFSILLVIILNVYYKNSHQIGWVIIPIFVIYSIIPLHIYDLVMFPIILLLIHRFSIINRYLTILCTGLVCISNTVTIGLIGRYVFGDQDDLLLFAQSAVITFSSSIVMMIIAIERNALCSKGNVGTETMLKAHRQ